MLKVGSVVLGFFQLVLGVPSKLALNAINKSLGVPKVLLEEGLELWPRNQSSALVAALVLCTSEADSAIDKGGGKRGKINPYSA